MQALIAVIGVLLLIAAVARAGLNPDDWLLFWWRMRRWLALIGLAVLLFAVAESQIGGTR
jgi:hypothetical protein